MRVTFKIHTLTLMVAAVFAQAAQAQEATENTAAAGGSAQIENIKVYGQRTVQATTDKVDRKTIEQEMIRGVRDLVRYTPDVGIVDNGRHLKGFAMRGVEGNRVGISVDGVNLPDSEENTLYARYGNFNPSRMSIDPEIVRNIDLVKGADSIDSGSGSLGGTVQYRTLNARDIVDPEQRFGALLRSGYATKNREWTNTAGVAFAGSQLDAIAVYSQRRGHEMKSLSRGGEYSTSSSQHPDPSQHRFHSYLGKIGWQISPEHRVAVAVTGQHGNNVTDERSYTTFGSQWRLADDESKRLNVNAHYEWTPESDYLAMLRTDYDYQKTELAAINHKGGRHWQTGEKQLDEIYNRSMNTRYQRLTLRADSQPLQWGGQHTLSFKAHIARRDFHNINEDTVGVGRSWESTERYTIQYPIRTTQYGFSLKDNIQWSPNLSSTLGLRYDHEKLAPQDLNAECSRACVAEGKPEGARFKNWSGFVGLNARLNPNWQLGYNLATGYRVPTASEMYFSFENPYGTWKSNPTLKSERSLSQTVTLRGESDKGMLDLDLYHTRYKDFLFESENLIEQTRYGRVYQTPMMQMVNLDKARIYGLEFKGRLNLDQVSPLPAGWSAMGAVGYSRGKLSGESSLLSIQPRKVILGLDYEQPDGRWGVFTRLTYLGAKKARDARTTEIRDRCIEWTADPWSPSGGYCSKIEKYKQATTYKYLNKSAYVFDIFGYYKPTKKLTLRAGIYNAFNRKYHTWDALRGINAHSTTNSVDRAGKGLERYHAPGRNYAVSLEYKF